MNRAAITLLLTFSLGACSVLPPEPPMSSGGAGDTLLAQANLKASRGQIQQAIATLERAVRLQPRNAHAWLRLAELYLKKGNYHKAEQFAGRAKQFSSGNNRLIRRSETVIQQAKAMQRQRG